MRRGKSLAVLLLAVGLALSALVAVVGASPAGAQCDVTADDFTTDGVLDLEGYLAAVEVCNAGAQAGGSTTPSAGGTQLSVTGRNVATTVAYAVAFIVVGGAIVVGTRLRRNAGEEL